MVYLVQNETIMVYLVLDSAEPAPVLLQVIEEGNVGPDVVLPLCVLLPGDAWGVMCMLC